MTIEQSELIATVILAIVLTIVLDRLLKYKSLLFPFFLAGFTFLFFIFVMRDTVAQAGAWTLGNFFGLLGSMLQRGERSFSFK